MCRQIETNRYGAKIGIDRKGTEKGNRKKGTRFSFNFGKGVKQSTIVKECFEHSTTLYPYHYSYYHVTS